MNAVIFAAGKSTRTYPLTLTRPKPLLPIANKSIMAHQIDALPDAVDTVVLIVGYKQEMIREAFGSEYKGRKLVYVEQKEQKGTGHALLQCADLIDAPFMAFNGDDLYAPDDFARLAKEEQAALAKEVDDPRLYGIFEVTAENNVVRLVEKPKEVFSNLANIGAYKFTPEVFDVLAHTPLSERGEIEITSAIQTLAEQGDFRVVTAEGYWLPIGFPWHLLDANAYMLDNHMPVENHGEISDKAEVKGPLYLGEGSVIRPGVYIEGPVMIGDGCKVGPNCYLRPGTVLGNGCKVGQGCEVKNSLLMPGSAVPHLSYVGDSVIGEKANLGCGTITANFRHDGKNHRSNVKDGLVDTGRRKLGAIIGDDVHTGINTSIYPGRKMWPHTSTLPGAVVREDVES
jgi:UDP-N-acetylglucosamine diphosphorylase / glucose-1-phosphate thymidylyltransferase / UDP-N-acetylgalactosamine diphosphorylase / glucosamine-1-phosphate N-acetyltransferase / galactosamine-1-phosphate N-acetyltransferase